MPKIDGVRELLEASIPSDMVRLVESGTSVGDLIVAAQKILKSSKFDLIHSHGFTAGVISLPLQFFYKTPQILTTHDVFSSANFFGVKGYFKKKLMRFVLNSITVIMPVGRDAEENINKFFPSLKSEVRAIRNGIPSRYFFNGVKRHLKNELRLSENAFLVGFFGRFMAQKGFRYLVEAIQKLSNEFSSDELRVVCFGWGGFIREEQENLAKLGIDAYFSFMSQTNDMPSAIKGVDLVAMPSLWEACPLLPMEVLCAGIPIVGTSCIGSKEVFDSTPAYVVPPRSSEMIVQVIDAEITEQTKQKFIDFAPVALERFSSKASAEKLESLYRKTIRAK